MAEWFPGLEGMSIEGDSEPDQVGAVRKKLLALSDQEYHQAYTILDVNLPVTNYTGHLQLHPLTQHEGPATFIEWWNEFDVPEDRREEVLGIFEEWFNLGLRELDDYVSDNRA